MKMISILKIRLRITIDCNMEGNFVNYNISVGHAVELFQLF